MHKHLTFALAAVAFTACAEPPTYDTVAPMPREEQLAAFTSASPTEKAAIYSGHLAHYAARRDVTAEQRDALTRAAALVTPDWYALAHDAPGWRERVGAPQEEMERLLRGAFGDQASRVMMTIGTQ